MPLTVLDPKTALIVIDLQKGLIGRVPEAIWNPVVENSVALIRAFRAKGLPVVLVNADGGAPGRAEHSWRGELPPGFSDLLDDLDVQPSDLLATKKTWGVFASTDLEGRLRALGVTQVVFTGVATSIGVESSARQAFEAGFNVTLATDAMADLTAEGHANSINLIFPKLGETGATADVLALVQGRT